MARFSMDDGTVVDTKNAKAWYEEDTRWDGNNNISVATGSQWEHQTLYKSAKGRWYIVSESQWQGSQPSAEYVGDADAVAWLLANNKQVPRSLQSTMEAVAE